MTQRGKRRLGYLEVVEKILKACPGAKTTLYLRSGLTYYVFHSPKYLPLILKQGLVRVETNNVHAYTLSRGIDAYILTAKGEQYLKLMKRVKELLGIGD